MGLSGVMVDDGNAGWTEEAVTLAILAALRQDAWAIVSYDFPQSGTGTLLRPNAALARGDKVKGGIIPDVVAVHSGVCLVLENKPRFAEADVLKLEEVRGSGAFNKAFERLLRGFSVERMLFGIGLPLEEARANAARIVKHLDSLPWSNLREYG